MNEPKPYRVQLRRYMRITGEKRHGPAGQKAKPVKRAKSHKLDALRGHVDKR